MRYSDKPISKPSQDVLGRAGFALQFARSIDGLSVADDGFVIAILGNWGSGKTSVIELIIRYLRDVEMERASNQPLLDDEVAVPCSIEQIEAMSEVYERVEERVNSLKASNLNLTYWERVRRIDDFRRWLGSEQEARSADRYWRLKCAVEIRRRTIVVRFSPWLIPPRAQLAAALLSELARALGHELGSEVRQAFAALLQRISELAPMAGTAIDAFGGQGVGRIISAGGIWSGKVAEKMADGRTLDEIRTHLRWLLGQLDDRRVLVVVDDLDRLTPMEALEMVSLVKSLGDLPNVIYMLSYEETILAQLIGNAIQIDGRSFLEKIVQYSAHLPAIANDELVRLLDYDLTTIVGELSDRDKKRLRQTWYFVFRHYLRTPRDVQRYVNSISVAMAALGDHVDVIDLIMLEVLRQFEPALYGWVRQNIDDLVR
jgi:KAP family P-loop domain